MNHDPGGAAPRESPGLLFLIGPRGSGKSTVARLLSAHLGWGWIDADAELERRHGRAIRDVFAAEGEAGFRDKEAVVLAELCRLRRHVVATGGGVALRPENRERLRAAGRVVWLTAEPATLAARLQADQATAERRPSLTGAAAASVEEILAVLQAREALYRACADHIASTEGRLPEVIAEEIAAWWRAACGSCPGE